MLFASVNEEMFLRDATGSTRYWVIAVDTVNHLHGIDMQQFWAQVLQVWKDGEQHWLTPEELGLLNAGNVDHEVQDDVEIVLRDTLDWEAPRERWLWLTATQVLETLGPHRFSGVTPAKIGRAVRRLNGGAERRSGAKRTVLVPPRLGGSDFG